MQFFTVNKLGPHQEVTPEGFLLCKDVPVARTGQQVYGPGETPVEPGPDGIVIIERPESEVFREETMASANGKPVTKEHPPMPEEDDAWTVDPNNFGQYVVGTLIGPRRGTGELSDTMVADLLVCERSAIDAIRDKQLVEISCGYACKYEQIAPGKGRQKDIVINHVALVGLGRCGARCAIHDKGGPLMKVFKDVKDRIRKAMKAHDEAGVEKALEEVKDEAPVEGNSENEGKIHERLDALEAGHKAHDALHTSHKAHLAAHDTQLASHEQKIKGLEKGPEGEEATDEEMKEEVPYTSHDRIRQVQDSSLMHDSYQSTIAGAEIIKPGMSVFTFDRAAKPGQTYKAICGLRRQALGHALVSDAALVTEARGNRPLSSAELNSLPCSQVRATFDSVVALKKRVNNTSNGSHVSTNNATKPKPKTFSDINKENETFWKGRT